MIGTEVGYLGGENEEPTYRHQPGHAEGIELTYDPAQTGFGEILDYFFGIHDPSTVDRQGNDRGSSYRSAIFIQDEGERKVAEELIQTVNDSKKWDGRVVTHWNPSENSGLRKRNIRIICSGFPIATPAIGNGSGRFHETSEWHSV